MIDPLQGGPPVAPEAEPLELPPPDMMEAEERHPTDPYSIKLGEIQFSMSAEDRVELGNELHDVIDAYQTAVRQRNENLDKIDDAYNMVVDYDATGTSPNSAEVRSELLRSHVNIASARVTDMMLSTNPFWEVELTDAQASDAEEKAADSQATERFLHAYLMHEARGRVWMPMAAHRATKQGAAVVRAVWDEKHVAYSYKDAEGNPREYSEDRGFVRFDLIGNRQMVFWPIHGLTIRSERAVVGHSFFLTPSQWRSYAAGLAGVTEETVKRVANAAPDSVEKEGDERDLEGKGIEIKGLNPFKGELQLYELWLLDYYLPGTSEPGNYRVIWWPDMREVLFIEENPLWCQNHPYFMVPYWLEDNSIWPTGAGHEILQNHKIDSALWNLFLDTLRVTANHIRKVKAGSMAESNGDAVGPGETIVTEDPEEDFRTEALGDGTGLEQTLAAMERNDFRAGRSTTVTPIEMGQGDPTLKSGASPGSYAQLRAGSSGKFKRVDENMREALSDLGLHILELFQQYGPDEVFYDYVSQETGDRLVRQKFRVPHGKLRERFRLRVRAASATSNQEVRKTNLMALYQMTVQHTGIFVQMIDQVLSPFDPVMAQRLKIESLRFLHSKVYRQLVEEQELEGMAATLPDMKPVPVEQIAQQVVQELMQQNQFLEQQLQQLMAGQGGPGGAVPAPS